MADPETETSPSPTPSAAKPTWRRLLSPQKFPGYFIAIVGLGWKILDIGGRLDFFWQAVQVMGGDAALVAMIILSPYFSVSLILFGVLYVIFVGDSVVLTIRHPAMPVVGWSIAGILLVFLSSILMFGYFLSQSKIRDITTFYERSTSERHLTDVQKVLLKEELQKIKSQISDNKIAVSAINGAPEAMQYAGEFINVIDNVGLLDVRFHQGDPKMAFPVYASSTSMHGIFIGVKNKDDPPESAKLFYTGLWRSGIVAEFAGHQALTGEFQLVISMP